MTTIHVDLGARSYPIHIGAEILPQRHLLAPHISGHQVMVVSNDTVAPLYLAQLQNVLDGHELQSVILPDGEQFKTLEQASTIFDALLAHGFERSCTLIALGGGVVGDITGFAAACYQRGVSFIQVPTTLLAQVDSSVGGKTGVNHPLGKNMIGAFHQPRCVLADTATLSTLPDRELSAGLAEVIKYGLINDPEFFDWLELNVHHLRTRSGSALTHAIAGSCRDKAQIVSADEREAGSRALLNLGHTFGHAIETGLGYGRWLHGEAVAVGMVMAADLSARLGWISSAQVERIRRLLQRAGLPVSPPKDIAPTKILELMAVDKKVQGGKLRLVLLRDIGRSVLVDDISGEPLLATIEDVCRAA